MSKVRFDFLCDHALRLSGNTVVGLVMSILITIWSLHHCANQSVLEIFIVFGLGGEALAGRRHWKNKTGSLDMETTFFRILVLLFWHVASSADSPGVQNKPGPQSESGSRAPGAPTVQKSPSAKFFRQVLQQPHVEGFVNTIPLCVEFCARQ
jgi:hypothetical protein